MIIRREDFGKIEDLTPGSHKKIWFICESCGIGVLQEYKNYLKQNDKKLCRNCRNKHTANRIDVKKKHSINAKNMWKKEGFKEKISPKLSKGCKKSWENDDRKKELSENNPMYKIKNRKLVSENTTTSNEELKKVAQEHGFEFLGRKTFQSGGVKLILKCKNGHISEKRLDVFRRGINGCKYCQGKSTTSKSEYEIFKFIKSIYKNKILKNNRKLLYPFELDIVIPEKKLAIEYCGLYWHSEIKKDKNYHINKLNKCNEFGYRLITIFEDEWIHKQDIVKNRLKYFLNLNTEKIYARKCEIKEISIEEARNFINKYHIQGYQGSNIKLGAFYDNKLIAVMTFSSPSLAKGKVNKNNYTYEISRFCMSINTIGIASKFIKYFQNNYEWNEIYSYADRRWSEGNLYEKIGMLFIKNTQPNYWYFKGTKRHHRFEFRKSMLKNKLEIFDSNLTEYKNMLNNGWNRIWDCGSKLYSIKK